MRAWIVTCLSGLTFALYVPSAGSFRLGAAPVGHGVAADVTAGPPRFGAQAGPALKLRPDPEAVGPAPAEWAGTGILAAVPGTVALEFGITADETKEINAHGVPLCVWRQRYHCDNDGFARIW
jgi:hypothetical protein